MSRDSIRRVIRTWLIATVGIFAPGLLGWLHDLTTWAHDQGTTPFPDAHGLAYLGVAAIAGGFIALLNLLVVGFEDGIGKGFLRAVPPRPTNERGEVGRAWPMLLVLVLVVVIVVAVVRG